MRKNRGAYKLIAVFTALVILSLCFSVQIAFGAEGQNDDGFIDTAEFEGKKIGVTSGSVYADSAQDLIKNPNLSFFKSSVDSTIALEKGKIDGVLNDEPVLRYYASKAEGIKVSRVKSKRDYYATIAGKTTKGKFLVSQLNEYYSKLKKTGELQEIIDKWVEGKDEDRVLDDYSDLPATKGEITIAVCPTDPPFNYVKDSMIVGLDAELMAGFCREYGYRPVMKNVDFDGIIAGVTTGKYDLGSSGLTITEERKQTVLFTDSFYSCTAAMAYREDSAFGKTKTDTKENKDIKGTNYTDPSEFDGKKIGVQTGMVHGELAPQYIKDPEIYYFKNQNDGTLAVQNGKIDAFMSDEPVLQYYASQVDGVECKIIKSQKDLFAPICNKDEQGAEYIRQLNNYMDKLKESGEMEKLEDKWLRGTDEDRVMDDYSNLPATNGKIVIAVNCVFPPFDYIKDNKIVGYEMEIVAGFCKEYGYKPVTENVEFDGIIAGVTTGKFDMGLSGFTVTKERKETVIFSDPIYVSQLGLAVKKEDGAGVLSLEGICNGLKKTFVTESRWKSFASGVYVTMKITVLSIIFGTILGFLVHLICRKGNKITNKISALARWLIQGMPEVVFLMIAYYIIFGKSSIGGATVAIIVFTLVFACVTHNLMESGEKSLDPGQKIAGAALGYSNMRVFMRIILPQIARGFLPAYLTAVSTHIKATAVVGYIAVVDITKVGDIVRGATYEAFYPLISVAILYFIMAGVLRLLVKISTRNLNPERRSEEQILKGVKIND